MLCLVDILERLLFPEGKQRKEQQIGGDGGLVLGGGEGREAVVRIHYMRE